MYITVSLDSRSYQVTDKGYSLLRERMERMSAAQSDVVRSIVMEDLERRLADYFSSIVGDSRILDEDDVRAAFVAIGFGAGDASSANGEEEKTSEKPEEPEDFNTTDTDSAGTERVRPNWGSRQLYRNTRNSTFGGVCSGLADRFGVDVVIIRLLFIFATVFLMQFWLVAVYCILWVVVPAASTRRQYQRRDGVGGNDDTDIDMAEGTEGEGSGAGGCGSRGCLICIGICILAFVGFIFGLQLLFRFLQYFNIYYIDGV